MKKIFIALWSLLCVTGQASLEHQVQSLIQEMGPTLSVGVEVETLEGGQSLVSLNAHRPYVTASVQKILTAAVAMSSLKDDAFATEFHYDKAQNLSYLIFNGDPLLTFKDLVHIITKARDKGMLGDKLYVLKGHPQEKPFLPPTSPGCTYEAMDFCHGGTFSTAIINQNRVLFDFDGASKKNKAQIKLHEGQPPFLVENHTFVQERCFKDDHVGRWDQVQRSAFDFDGEKVLAKGCVSKDFKTTICLPVQSHDLNPYLAFSLKEALKISGGLMPIEFRDVMKGDCRKGFKYSAAPLSKLLKLSLKDSHNLVTDALFSKVTQKKEWPRNWVFAGKVLQEKVQNFFGVTFGVGDEISSGSGFSFYNRLQPKTVVQILRKTQRVLGERFLQYFPIAGESGTLKNRLQDIHGVRIRAKTGHLNGVSSLAGYLQRPGKETLAFAVFVGGSGADAKKRRQLIDAIVALLAKV